MKRILISIFLLSAFVTFSQEVFKGEHFIEVTGSASQEIEPNEIYMLVRLKEFEENRSKVTLEKLDSDFLNALKDAGIDKKRLELADAGSQIGRLGRKDKDAFREKTYQIKLTSAAELEKFLAKLEPVKVDYADISRLSHSDYEKIKIDLKIKALQAAKAKAETLLKSIGAEIGKPLMVRDWEVEPMQPMVERMASVRMKSDVAEESTGAAFRKIKLQAQITAQFEIK
jgi:uncharacterized protein YggE